VVGAKDNQASLNIIIL